MAIQPLLEIELTVDGKPVENFPYVRRLDLGALHPFTQVAKAGTALAPFPSVGNKEIDPVTLAVLVSDGVLTWRFDGQTDGGVAMAAPGEDEVNVLILVDVNLDAGPVANIGAPGADNSVTLYGVIGGDSDVAGDCLGYGEGGYGEGGYGCGADE